MGISNKIIKEMRTSLVPFAAVLLAQATYSLSIPDSESLLDFAEINLERKGGDDGSRPRPRPDWCERRANRWADGLLSECEEDDVPCAEDAGDSDAVCEGEVATELAEALRICGLTPCAKREEKEAAQALEECEDVACEEQVASDLEDALADCVTCETGVAREYADAVAACEEDD